MCSSLQKSPAKSPRTVTANHAKYTKRIRVFRVVRGQKICPPNLTCSRRRTKSVSHGRQPPLAHENTLAATAASRWLHALVRRRVTDYLNHNHKGLLQVPTV